MIKTIEYISGFILLILAQIFIFDNISIMGYVNSYIYIMFIIILPMEIRPALLLLVGFGMGALMDLFTGNMGLCAMTATLIAFARPSLLTLISGREVVNNGGIPSARTMGVTKFWIYIIGMTLIYNISFFLLERMTMVDIFHTTIRILLSTIFTSGVIYLIHLLIIRKSSTWR